MSTLNQIRLDILNAEKLLIESNGEVTEELNQLLEINENNLALKVDSYKYVIDGLEDAIEFFKHKEDEAKRVRKSYEAFIDSMKERLKLTIQSLNTNEIVGNEYRFSLATGKPKVEIIDVEKLPASYVREKVTYEPDKIKIGEALQNGEIVDGARLVETNTLRTYLVKKGK